MTRAHIPHRQSTLPATSRLTLLALFLSAVTASAHAAEPGDVAVERMRLASTRDGIIGVEAGTVPEHLAWETGAWLGWSKDPLVVVRLSDGERAGALVRDRLGGSLVGALGLWGRAAVAVELPFVLYQDREAGDIAIGALAPLSSAGLGAARIVPRYAVLRSDEHGIDLSVMAGLRLPGGAQGSFVSSRSFELEPEVAASRTFGAWRLAANVGAIVRSTHHVADLEAASELTFQVGVARRVELGARLPSELMASVSGAGAVTRPLSREVESAVEARAAAGWDLRLPVRILAGVGVGLTDGWGAPAWRIFVAAQSAPRPAPPSIAAALPGPATAPIVEAPPAAPAADPAPVAPPAPPPPSDRDGDGIVDAADRCPSEAGPAENGGCPDGDRDSDGVVDRLDECPDVPGVAEARGCPRSGAVKLAGERIEFEGSVYFDSDRDAIQSRSFELLEGIAAVIKAHPEVGLIRVEGHTDASGSRGHNVDLSRRRAKAVVRHLAGKGIDAARLTGEGFGPDRAVADNQTADGRAKNRRVEFHVEQPPAAGEKP